MPEGWKRNAEAARASAGYYDRLWSQQHDVDSAELERLSEISRTLDSARVECRQLLDVGCGRGWLAAAFPDWDYTGVDFAEAALERARAEHPRARFLFRSTDCSLSELLDDARFGVVLASEVIEHVADAAAFVGECATALQPGGYLLLTTPNALLRAAWIRRQGEPPQPVEEWQSPDQLRELVEAQGLRVVEHRGFDFSLQSRLGRLRARYWGESLRRGLYQILLCQAAG